MDKIVLFETYYNPIEASIVKERLIASGIPCFLSDENSVTLNPLYNQALGGVKLRLFDRDLAAAKSILQDQDIQIMTEQADQPETPQQGMASSHVCEACGSEDVGYVQATKSRFGIITIIVSLMLMVYPFSVKKTYHCFNCEHEFDA